MSKKSYESRAYQIHIIHKQLVDFNNAVFHDLIFTREQKQQFKEYNTSFYTVCGKLSYAVDLAMTNNDTHVDKMLYEVIDEINEITRSKSKLQDLNSELRACVCYFLRNVIETLYELIEQTKTCSYENISK